MKQFTCPKAVTHPSTNRARCRATALIETNALPLHQTANQYDILADCAFSNNNFLQTYLASWSSQFGNVPEVMPTKQPFWDRPGVLVDKALVEASLNSPHSRASFLAASCQHSGDWLFALPIASCGLKLDDEAVRVAVGLRLGLDLCVRHECHCGSMVDARGVHSLVCKKAPGRTARHHALNDLIARGFASAVFPVTKEPMGLFPDRRKAT